MRRRKTDKLPWGYDFCLLPEPRKVFLIAGHQIVRTRSVRTFHKYIVRWISCCFNLPGRDHEKPVQRRILALMSELSGRKMESPRELLTAIRSIQSAQPAPAAA